MKNVHVQTVTQRWLRLGAAALLAASALIPASTLAANPPPPAKCAGTDVRCIIGVGDRLITAHLAALSTLNSTVSTYRDKQKITSSQARVLQSDITASRTVLKQARARLDAETVASAASADIAGVIAQYRINTVVIPRDYRLLALDIGMKTRGTLQAIIPTLDSALGFVPEEKQPQINALYNDYRKQVATAHPQLNSARKRFPALTQANYNQRQPSFTSDLQALDNALTTAQNALQRAVRDLKKMGSIVGIQ